MSKGLIRDECLALVGLTKNQFYYIGNGRKTGRPATTMTAFKNSHTQATELRDNSQVIDQIIHYKLDPDYANHYRIINFNLCL